MQDQPGSHTYRTLEPRVALDVHLKYDQSSPEHLTRFPHPSPMYNPGHPQGGHQSLPPQGQPYQTPGQQPVSPVYSSSPGSQQYNSQLNPNRPEMTAIHPQYQQPYGDPSQRLPAPPGPPQYYQPQPQPDYRSQQPPQVQQQGAQQAAPRQRTAIACKYCRRRKIRCSGFENAADGRCQNCHRFNQECVFTPVSSQTQAFVPAQAVYGPRGQRPGPPPQLYGPYGQPLPRQDQYPGYTLPSPGHPPPMQQGYAPSGYPPQGYAQGYPPQSYEQQPGPGQGQAAGNRRRREDDEPHTPTLPPPNPGPNSSLAGHEQQYMYEQPTYAGSPAAPGQNPYQAQGYYPAQPQRTSPGSAFAYEQPRTSNSPHTGGPYYGQQPMQSHAGVAQPNQQNRPSPGSDGRNGLAIRDIVSDNGHSQGERTAADSDMVSALNRTSRR